MHRPLFLVLLSVWVTLTLAACGGSGPVAPPDNFTRLTASVVDSAGQPVEGLSVRVEGTNTGETTDAAGNFNLGREAFPNGVTASNEISLGRNGIVMGVGEYVPVAEPILALQFGVNFGLEQPGDPTDPNLEPGSLSGNVFNESTGEALTGVELTLFANTGQLLSTTSDNGFYEFDPVAAGDWRLTAFFEGYHPEAAAVNIPEGTAMVQHLALVPDGVISPGDGLKVQGTLRDSDTGEPIAGATISMMADTGYIGMPEQGYIDDMDEWTDSSDAVPPTGVFTEPGSDKDPSMAPWNYDPQYQETTTDADGTFEFEQEVVGYSLWLDFYAEGYLNGNHYEDIYERTGVLDLNLELDPYVSTSIAGTVVDGDGLPLEGAYVEFIFSSGFDNTPIDIAMPGVMDFETLAEDGMALRGDIGAPAPPPTSDPTEGSGGWDEWANDAAPMFGGAEQGGSPSSGPGVDNQMMQRFRWENQQGNHGTSDAAFFTGYYGTNSDENGDFSFEDVPAGPYYVFATAYRHLPYDSMLEIFEDPAENSFEIILQHVPVGAVEGIITDENGTPLPDVLVTCTQPNVDPFSYTDEGGYYIIDNVPTGMWIISGYKTGYLTYSVDTPITENATAQVNLSIVLYEPPQQTIIAYSGHVVSGSDNSGVVGADVIFTPVNNEFGQWYQHLTSGSNGAYSAQLIATEYNVLIQQDGYEDLYIRIWVDSTYPQMDFWLWPIGGGGGGWGGAPMPMMDAAMGMPERGDDA